MSFNHRFLIENELWLFGVLVKPTKNIRYFLGEASQQNNYKKSNSSHLEGVGISSIFAPPDFKITESEIDREIYEIHK